MHCSRPLLAPRLSRVTTTLFAAMLVACSGGNITVEFDLGVVPDDAGDGRNDVGPMNGAPSADDQAASTDEDSAIDITLTGSDPEDDALTFAVVDGPTNGTLTGTGPGVTYTPNANFNGTDTFTFGVSDGLQTSDAATVTITINPVNDAPTVMDVSRATDVDVPVSITLVGDDVDGDDLTFTPSVPDFGTLVDNLDGTYTYTPPAGQMGTATFTYTANDGELDSGVGTVTVTIGSGNAEPIADPQTLATDEDTPLDITLTGSDREGATLSFQVTAGPSEGTLDTTTGSALVYTPNQDFNGEDSFSFVANDGTFDSDPVTVTITVNPVNDPPSANDVSESVDEGAAVDVTLDFADVDDADADLTVLVLDAAAPFGAGAVVDGVVRFTHDGSEMHGDFQYTYEVCDDEDTPACVTAFIDLSVSPVNDPPVVQDSAATIPEGGMTSVDPRTLVTDPDSVVFSSGLIAPAPAHGSLSVGTDGLVTYTHDGGETTTDSVGYEVCDDGTPALCDSGTFTITITPVNDPPVAQDGALTIDEDDSGVIDVASLISDPDDATLTISVPSDPAMITTSVSGTQITITHAGDQPPATVDVVYEVCDDETPTAACDTATITVTINALNDPPVAQDGAVTVPEDGSNTIDVSTLISDADDTNLTISVVADPSELTTGVLGTVITVNHSGDQPPATIPFDYEVCDDETPTAACDTATITVTITPINDPPVAQVGAITVPEDGSNTIDVSTLISDPDHTDAQLTISVTAESPDAELTTGVAGRVITVSHGGNDNPSGSYSITYRACDPGTPSLCDSATIAVTVTPINDPPTVTNDTFNNVMINTILEVGGYSPASARPKLTLSGNLLTNDSDPESAVSVVPASGSSAGGGSFTVAADGSFTYTPAAGERSSDSFTYQATDGSTPVAATVTLNLAHPIWWIDNTLTGTGGDGTSADPFRTLAEFDAVQGVTNGATNGDRIYVHGGGANYTGGIALLDDQRVTGQGVALSFNGVNLAAGSAPIFVSGTAPLLTLAAGNTAEGLTLRPSVTTGLAGNPSGTTTLAQVSIVAAVGATARLVSLSSVAGSFVWNGGSVAGSSSVSSPLLISGNTGSMDINIPVALQGGAAGSSGLVQVQSGSGATRFNGGLNLSANAGCGLVVTNAGTVEVVGSANTVSSLAGCGVNIDTTNIGANGVTLVSVDATTNAGIRLNNSGTGPFTVTGTGSTGGSGGTLTDALPGTGTDAAIQLTNAANVTINNVNVNDAPRRSVYAENVTGLTMTGVVINDTTAPATAAPPPAVELLNNAGNVVLANMTLTNVPGVGIAIDDGGNDTYTIDGLNAAAQGAFGGLWVSTVWANATGTFTVQNSTFTTTRNNTGGVSVATSSGGSLRTTVTNNRFVLDNPFDGPPTIGVAIASGSAVTATVSGNRWVEAGGPAAIALRTLNTGSQLTATVDNNEITGSTNGSAANLQRGIDIDADGGPNMIVSANGNVIEDTLEEGIATRIGSVGAFANGQVDLTMENNDVRNTATDAFTAQLYVDRNDPSNVCVVANGNIAIAPEGAAIEFDDALTSGFTMEAGGSASPVADTACAENNIDASDGMPFSPFDVDVPASVTVVANGSCRRP